MSHEPTRFSAILQALARLPQAEPAARRGKQPSAATVPESSFCAQGSLALDALSLQVNGVGLLQQPVAHEQGRALHGASRPALHGQREATVLDTRVRHTGEIAADALTLHWSDGVLQALQADVAQALGLAQVEARLHKLLVYGPGQFFKPHQDTEKHPGMVATLVLLWPSAHIGGTLRVVHGRQQAEFSSQHLRADTLRWFAFYADCQHEVLPVQEGWRVVLTFDLVLPTQAALAGPKASPELLAALRAQCFPDGQPSADPWVFLLDHEYSQRGLRWTLLKGLDRPRVAALQAAAQELGLVTHLALAEIHESWTATGGGGGRYSDDPEPDELIDEDLTLDFWVDTAGQVLRRQSLYVRPRDTEGFFETGEDYLVNEEYEGYMGNYGETLDYWYRRAAWVVQTPQAEQASRFTTDFDAALQDALQLARSGDAHALAQRLQPVMGRLQQRSHGEAGRGVWPAYAELAAALPDDEQALGLCQGFAWVQWRSTDAAALAGLAERRGEAWTRKLLQAWVQPQLQGHTYWHREAYDDRPLWPQPLPAFVQACQKAALSTDLQAELLRQCQIVLAAQDQGLARATPAVRKSALGSCLQRAVELAQALQHVPRSGAEMAALLAHVRQHPELYPLLALRPLLQTLAPHADLPKVQALRTDVLRALQQALQQAEPSTDDHSLRGIEWVCRCSDCASVIAWAESPTPAALTLAMAEPRRNHVQEKLQQAAAPLSRETVKRGRPYTLVIRKPAGLHAALRAQRQKWQEDWAALQDQ